MANKFMIAMHIGMYLSIIIIDVLVSFLDPDDLTKELIMVICKIAVYAICNVIFGLIVN